MEYAVDTGKFDVAFCKGSNALSVIRSSELDNLHNAGNVFGKSGVSGKGSIDFEADPVSIRYISIRMTQSDLQS